MTRSIGLHRWGEAQTGAPKAGAPVILLHGWTMTGDIWDPLARLLPAPSLAPDLPGHGATRGYEPSVGGGVALLRDLIAAHDIRDATLVGWSLGALIGWSYLAQGGTGVARMVSLDMSPRPLPAPGWACPMRNQSAARAARAATRFRRDWPAAARAIAQTMFARPEGCPRFPASEAEARIRARDPESMARFWESLIALDLRAELAALDQPLLALHGAHSRVYAPETGAWIATHARHGQSRVLNGCGHAPNLEDPVTTAAAIAAFHSPA